MTVAFALDEQTVAIRPWLSIRRRLGVSPVVAGTIPGAAWFAERYFVRRATAYAPALPCITLYCQLGGARVREMDGKRTRVRTGPDQASLVPAGIETFWHYEGSIDFAVFYLTDPFHADCERLRRALANASQPMAFSSVLINACARQVVDELQVGRRADRRFLEHLGSVMLERLTRVVASDRNFEVDAPAIQLARLQSVVAHIQRQLAGDLSVERLAGIARVSPPHFRKLFRAAVGVPPHRYVLQRRIDQAREMLAQCNWPMSRIAEECGFCSQSHFTHSFNREVGMTPSEFRGRGRRDSQRRARSRPGAHV